MGIQDYKYRLMAQAGDSAPHDELGISGDLAGATIALVDRGGGDWVWRFTGKSNVSVPACNVNPNVSGGGITMVMRVAIPTYGATYTPLAGFGTDATSTYCHAFSEESANAHGFRWKDLTQFIAEVTTGVYGGIRTYVVRTKVGTADNTDGLTVWRGTTGRVGTNPDYNYGSTTFYDRVYNTIFAGLTGAVLDISDWVIYDEELSDADCAALADGLRTVLSATNIACSVGNAAAAGSPATIVVSGAVSIAGGIGNAVAAGSTATVSVSSQHTISTPPLKNNAGTLLANASGITAYVHHAATNALLLTKAGASTNAAGILSITDNALVQGVSYRVVVVMGDGASGMDVYTAL